MQGSLLQILAHHILDGVEGSLDACNIRVRVMYVACRVRVINGIRATVIHGSFREI